jgi:hypothetical protein
MTSLNNKWILGISFLLIVACGGNVAMPIKTEREGDTSKSCKSINWELGEIEKDITEIIGGGEVSPGQNLAMLLLAGPLGVDPGTAQKQEIKDYKKRYNHLLKLGNTKSCNINKKAFPET